MIQPSVVTENMGASTLADLAHLAPMVIVGTWGLLLLATDAFTSIGFRLFQRRIALFGLALAFVAGLSIYGNADYDGGVAVFRGFLVVDQFSALLDLVLVGLCAGTVLVAGDYARTHRFEYGEQESLLCIATFGAMMVVHAQDLLALFLGIETMSIAVYVLVGARWNAKPSAEAALKYFLMGAFASAILLMGMALLYGAAGTTHFEVLRGAVTEAFVRWLRVNDLARALDAGQVANPAATDLVIQGVAKAALLLPGILMVLGALLFKVSAVPMHMWTPDAYEGAPTPVTAYMASVVKVAGVAALLRVFVAIFSSHRLVTAPYGWTTAVALVAFLTMTVGNLAAVRQTNVKRLLAYSSIAHVGYLLLGVVAAANFYGQAYAKGPAAGTDALLWSRAAGDAAVAAVVLYIVLYAVASLGAFVAVAWLSGNKHEALESYQWAGLARRHPGMALGLTICLLSLMGLPPVAGFFGKLFLFRAVFENSNDWLQFLVVWALLNAVVGAYYYLRLVVAMYFREPPRDGFTTLPGRGGPAVVAVSAFLSLAIGGLMGPALDRVDLAARAFNYPAGASKARRVDDLRADWETRDAGGEALGGEVASEADAAPEE
ncbi:MAG: NADH-quinone oxidoreductase subunit N [Deltaproteobacteria bacterium]|nr:MAG: NADH-quinone oxidoreductase subunit N [Deltaproteobacteria bacterium]